MWCKMYIAYLLLYLFHGLKCTQVRVNCSIGELLVYKGLVFRRLRTLADPCAGDVVAWDVMISRINASVAFYCVPDLKVCAKEICMEALASLRR